MLSLRSRTAAARGQCKPDRDSNSELLHLLMPTIFCGPGYESGTIDLEAGDRPSPQGHSPDRVRSSRTASLLSVFLFLEVEDNTEFGRGNVSFRLRNLGSTNRSARQRCG